MNEGRIATALKTKHDTLGDIFASQVKIGPAGSKIMDAVAIKKTWSPRTVIGYEIKVSRQDFLRDQKHPVYMDNCNIFYFVTPVGIIQDGELPQGAGHMIYNSDTGKLRTKKKAPYRKQTINPDVLLHIMFWKMERYFGHRTRAEILADYEAKKHLSSIGKEVAVKISDLEREIKYLKSGRNAGRYEDLQKKWKELFGTTYIDLDAIPLNNGLSTYDIDTIKRSAEMIARIMDKRT